MLFQTPEFLVLFIASVAGVALLRRNSRQHLFLAALSYVFYAWLDVRFLILLLITTIVDYAAALGMDSVRLSWKRRWGLSALTVVGAAFTLGLNWPLLQAADRPPFTWEAFFNPTWRGLWPSLIACVAFAALWPLAYEALFRGFPGPRRRKAFLVASVISNLTVLGFFKYFNFFVDSFVRAGEAVGLELSRPHLSVLLPMGISFYTFVSMSYTIDAYRGKAPAERSFRRFALFVAYFPHLVAGPIIRPENFLPTLHEPWSIRGRNVVSGFHLALVGLFKKVLIADAIAPLVNQIFADPAGGASSLVVILGAGLFAIQIYCDFSGYSDIARGVSRMLGPELPINFDYPYFSTSVIEFWRRWHISLSTWLRDYLYIPIGGGRGSRARVALNLMITMVLGGMWHGASWNFVLWGFYQGALLCANRAVRAVVGRAPLLGRALESKPGTVVRWAVTMWLVLLGWLIFRVQDSRQLWYCIEKFVIFDGSLGLASSGLGRGAPFLAVMWATVFAASHTISRVFGPWQDRLDRTSPKILPFVYATLAVVFFYFFPSEEASFIYFQF